MTQPLQYYLHDDPDAFRIELSGILAGDGAQSVYHAWRTAISLIDPRQSIIDLTYVCGADERGRALIRLWHKYGARLIATSPESSALAESILGDMLPHPRAGRRFFEGLRTFFPWLAAGAIFPARAGEPQATSAEAARKSTEIAMVSGQCELDHRLR